MDISCVLSSGRPLFQVSLAPNSSVQALKSLISRTLLAQLSSVPLFPPAHWTPPAAFSFHSCVTESLDDSLAFLECNSPRLFLSSEEVLDSCDIDRVKGLVCVLRPTDLIARYSDLQGYPSRTVINIEENLYWKGERVRPEAGEIDLLVATSNCYVVCAVLRSETVLQLKRRLVWLITSPIALTSVLFEDRKLEEEEVLEACGVGNWSFLRVFSALEETLPAPNLVNFPNYARIMQVLKSDWWPYSNISNFTYLNRQISSKDTHFVTFRLSKKSKITVNLPKRCDLRTAQLCISEQHGFPAALAAIGLVARLDLEQSAEKYGISNGDFLILLQKSARKETISLYFECKNKGKTALSVSLSELISSLKAKVRPYFPSLSPPLTLFMGRVALDDNCTVQESGLSPDDQVLVSGSLLPYDNVGKRSKNQSFVPAEIREISRPQVSKEERTRRYHQKYGNSQYCVKVISPGNTLLLRVSPETKAEELRERLRKKLGIQSFRLRSGNSDLEEGKTLMEQGIGYNDSLLLLTPTCISVSVVTPAGQVYPVLLEPDAKLTTLNTALGRLPGLPKQGRAYTFSKRITQETAILPLEACEMHLWLQMGVGAEVQFEAVGGREVRVETTGKREEVRQQLREKLPAQWADLP